MRRGQGLARRLAQAAQAAEPAGLLGAGQGAPSAAAALRPLRTGRPARWPTHLEDELYCRQRSVLVLGSRVPFLAPDAWVAPNATVVGDVDLFNQVRAHRCCACACAGGAGAERQARAQVSVWYGCVLRGDLNSIKVGAFSNVQERTVIHAARRGPDRPESCSPAPGRLLGPP